MELHKSKEKVKKIFIFHGVILTVLVIIMAFVITEGKSIFGSTTDWLSQHSVIPEYFRQKFYETGDFFSQFSFHLGAGQNSYSFVYHGYLNPIILVSYLLPFVPMESYIIGSTIAVLIASLLLFYYWMNKKGFSASTAFFASLLFLFSTSFMYHAHKQVMFIQYMPFLILALMGVDEFIQKKKRPMLVIGTLLMLLTSYFFSVAGVMIITIYAVHEYLETNNKFSVKDFIKTGMSYAATMMSAALMSLVTLLPALLAILSGREKDLTDAVDFAELLIPKLKISTLFYYGYGMGLTCICFVALIAFLLSKKKSRVFLSVSILISICIPMVTYVLNIFLYENTKVFITFIPIMCYIIASFVKDIKSNTISIRPVIILTGVLSVILIVLNVCGVYKEGNYIAGFAADMAAALLLICISVKFKNTKALMCVTVAVACAVSITIGKSDTLISKELASEMYNEDKSDFIKDCLKDEDNFCRSNDLSRTVWSCNFTYGSKFYQTGLYSSVYNRNYNRFTHDEINISNTTVNNISNVDTNDMLFARFMGVKYIFAPEKTAVPYGYRAVRSSENVSMYESDDVYSAIFASDKLMSEREFDSLPPAERKLALLGYIVVDKDIPDTYTPKVTELKLDFCEKGGDNLVLPLDIAVDEGKKFSADVSALTYDGYIVEVTIDDLAQKTSSIKVNGIENAISAHHNAFPKANKTFSFVVTSPDDINKLDISFKRGGYKINSIKCYGFSYDDVEQLKENITMSNDTKVTGDNTMRGTVDMKNDGYINITVPYDEGFKLYLDGVETEFEKTDSAFIGVRASAGVHEVVLEYHTPGLAFGYVMGGAGLVMFAVLLIYDKKRGKKSNL